jgi:hypothetical protein
MPAVQWASPMAEPVLDGGGGRTDVPSGALFRDPTLMSCAPAPVPVADPAPSGAPSLPRLPGPLPVVASLAPFAAPAEPLLPLGDELPPTCAAPLPLPLPGAEPEPAPCAAASKVAMRTDTEIRVIQIPRDFMTASQSCLPFSRIPPGQKQPAGGDH